MRAWVHVTAEDIQNGIPIHASSCPVAIATRRRFGGTVIVSEEWMAIERFDRIFVFSKRVRYWLSRFDKSRPVRPFRFSIEVPDVK